MGSTSALDPSSPSQSSTSDDDFLAFVQHHFDRTFYLESNSDVADSGLGPLEHWLSHGLHEGRQISSHVILRIGKTARRSSNRVWRRYRWRETDIAVRVLPPVPPEIIAQIFDQARHEPAILAAGADAVTKFFRQDRENVYLDIAGLERALPQAAEFVFIMPNVACNDDQRLAADLITTLGHAGFRSLQVIVADEEAPDTHDKGSVPAVFRPANVLFWLDYWIQGPEYFRWLQLAQLIRALRPRVTIIGSSREAHEMIARFGRALAADTKMFCLCTGAIDDNGSAAPFPRRALAFAAALTDDAVVAARLRDRAGDALAHGITVLPHHSAIAFQEAVVQLFARP